MKITVIHFLKLESWSFLNDLMLVGDDKSNGFAYVNCSFEEIPNINWVFPTVIISPGASGHRVMDLPFKRVPEQLAVL